jgi:hypothetical protein
MKKALVSPNEVVTSYDGTTGQRVAETAAAEFEVAPPLFWLDCSDECEAGLWFYRGGALEPIPQAPEAAQEENP